MGDRAPAPREPDLVTDPALRGVLEELRGREPIFHRPGLGTTRADFAMCTSARARWTFGLAVCGMVGCDSARSSGASGTNDYSVSPLGCSRSDQSPEIFADGRRVILDAHVKGVDWRPCLQDAERANDGVAAFLKRMRPDIAPRLPSYYAQISGTAARSGRNVIHLNFFCDGYLASIASVLEARPQPWNVVDYWTRNRVQVSDGGSCYFFLDYDQATGGYLNLSVNESG